MREKQEDGGVQVLARQEHVFFQNRNAYIGTQFKVNFRWYIILNLDI